MSFCPRTEHNVPCAAIFERVIFNLSFCIALLHMMKNVFYMSTKKQNKRQWLSKIVLRFPTNQRHNSIHISPWFLSGIWRVSSIRSSWNMKGPLLWTFLANSDEVNKALHQKVLNRKCVILHRDYGRVQSEKKVYSSDFHLSPSREYFIKIAEHSETTSFKLFSKETSNFFKCLIKTAPSWWAAVVGNEEDYIFDKYLNTINLHLFFYLF